MASTIIYGGILVFITAVLMTFWISLLTKTWREVKKRQALINTIRSRGHKTISWEEWEQVLT